MEQSEKERQLAELIAQIEKDLESAPKRHTELMTFNASERAQLCPDFRESLKRYRAARLITITEQNGKTHYIIRFNKGGYDITAEADELDEAKQAFILQANKTDRE